MEKKLEVPSQLINIVFGMPGVSDFINKSSRNRYFKRLWTTSTINFETFVYSKVFRHRYVL